jgi:hypothetical protein
MLRNIREANGLADHDPDCENTFMFSGNGLFTSGQKRESQSSTNTEKLHVMYKADIEQWPTQGVCSPLVVSIIVPLLLTTSKWILAHFARSF